MLKIKYLFFAFIILSYVNTFAASQSTSDSLQEKINHCSTYMFNHEYPKAIECYQPYAKQGESHAQFNLGMAYEEVGDFSNAFKWYKKSAAQDSLAQAKTGEMYIWGKGTSKNCSEGLFLINKAASQYNIWAVEDLVKIYKFGICVKKNPKMASYWYDVMQSIQK